MPKKSQPAKRQIHSEVREPATTTKLTQLVQKQNKLLIKLLKQEHESTTILGTAVNQQKQFIEMVSKRRFRTFLDSLPSLIVHAGTDQRVTFCNEKFTTFFGLTRQQTIGKPIWDLPTDYDSMRSHIIEALKGNQVTFEHKLHGPHDGCFHVTITPDFGLDDAVEGFFISLLDITERKALEEKQRQSENQFRGLAKERAELLRVKDQFLRTVFS